MRTQADDSSRVHFTGHITSQLFWTTYKIEGRRESRDKLTPAKKVDYHRAEDRQKNLAYHRPYCIVSFDVLGVTPQTERCAGG